MSKLQRDFTTGPIGRGMIAFAMPFLLSNILQALYGAVDMWVVGNFSAADATVRTAVAAGRVTVNENTFALIKNGGMKKLEKADKKTIAKEIFNYINI